jgi:hypothetical protein
MLRLDRNSRAIGAFVSPQECPPSAMSRALIGPRRPRESQQEVEAPQGRNPRIAEYPFCRRIYVLHPDLRAQLEAEDDVGARFDQAFVTCLALGQLLTQRLDIFLRVRKVVGGHDR